MALKTIWVVPLSPSEYNQLLNLRRAPKFQSSQEQLQPHLHLHVHLTSPNYSKNNKQLENTCRNEKSATWSKEDQKAAHMLQARTRFIIPFRLKFYGKSYGTRRGREGRCWKSKNWELKVRRSEKDTILYTFIVCFSQDLTQLYLVFNALGLGRMGHTEPSINIGTLEKYEQRAVKNCLSCLTKILFFG